MWVKGEKGGWRKYVQSTCKPIERREVGIREDGSDTRDELLM